MVLFFWTVTDVQHDGHFLDLNATVFPLSLTLRSCLQYVCVDMAQSSGIRDNKHPIIKIRTPLVHSLQRWARIAVLQLYWSGFITLNNPDVDDRTFFVCAWFQKSSHLYTLCWSVKGRLA
jgi:hypothetical protein